jgi:sulfotransferase family protein
VSLPEVPNGVRPVVGEHLSHIAIPTRTRLWRETVNFGAVADRRVRGRARGLPAAPDYRKLFVVGCGRSGTSWVQGIIASHPRVITTQESHAYEVVYDPVTRRGRASVNAWTKVLHRHDLTERKARWVGLHWWINRAHLLDLIDWGLHAAGTTDADAAESVIEAIFDTYFVGRGGTEQNMLLEKTPGHLAYAQRILRRFPDARVVEVLRDGRDVCVSMQMQGITLSWPPESRRAQINTWVRAARRGLALRADPALADRVHLVRYEELKRDPAFEIARLFEFLGLDATPDFVDEVGEASDFRHHRTTGAGYHTRRGEVGDWRNHFSGEDEELFRALAGDVFEALGYEL